MATTRHIAPFGLIYAPGRIELPLHCGTPLVVYFDTLDELGIYLAHSPLHWQDPAQVLALVKQFMREDYEQGDAGPQAMDVALRTEPAESAWKERRAPAEAWGSSTFQPPTRDGVVALAFIALSAGLMLAAVAQVARCVFIYFG